MKTQQELMQAYWGSGGTVDSVKEYNAKHVCDVKPWECVKLEGVTLDVHPNFDGRVVDYDFALTILYDDKRKKHRPVWVGSELYANNCTKPLTIKGKSEQWGYLSIGECTNYAISILSWNPPAPKRTFKIEIDEKQLELLITVTRPFCTGNHWSELFTLLTEARDKE